MLYILALQNVCSSKDSSRYFRKGNFFIVNMNFHDSNSSYREKYIIVKCLWIQIDQDAPKLLSSFVSGKGSLFCLYQRHYRRLV